MKLFNKFDAVRFPEEDLIFITNDGYLYYIYDLKYKSWKKHRNAGNDHITVSNYPDIAKEELMEAAGGTFPNKETDFMRLCSPAQLNIGNLLDLLKEDYPRYLSDREILNAVRSFLSESTILHKSFLALKPLFDKAIAHKYDKALVLCQIKKLCLSVIGRNIFKREIGIVDGHDSSSYFWIMPVRIIDYADTGDVNSVAEMRSVEISIEEEDVRQYLTPFLYKHFDGELKANKNRVESYGPDEDGNRKATYVRGFEWYLTYNYYSFGSMMKILRDINDTIDTLFSGRENAFTPKLRKISGAEPCESPDERYLRKEQLKAYRYNCGKSEAEDRTEVDLIIDFYRRFVYRIEYMMNIGREKGYDLISFMGP